MISPIPIIYMTSNAGSYHYEPLCAVRRARQPKAVWSEDVDGVLRSHPWISPCSVCVPAWLSDAVTAKRRERLQSR